MKTKMKLTAALKTWVVVYPSITLLLYLLGESPLVLPLYLKTLLLSFTLVPWIIFAGIPFIDFIIRRVSTKENK